MLNQAEIGRVFQALADPCRRAMVEQLTSAPASVSDLARPLAISLAAVVQHVQVLEAAGLVHSEKVGRVRTCRIEPATLSAAASWLVARRADGESRLDALAACLEEEDAEGAVHER